MQKIMSYISEPTGNEQYTNYLTFGSLNDDKGVPITDITPIGESLTPDEMKPKRGRPKGSTTNKKKLSDGSEIILADETPQQELPMYQSNQSYKETYEETNTLLRGSIGQIDQLQSELKGELDSIRASKTLKKKYDYISMLGSTAASLINTKVSVIKEMNKVITDSHNLDLKRMKELKVTENQVDDDKRIMDMYQAFVSTPVGNGAALGPNMTDITLMTGINNMLYDVTNYNRANNLTIAGEKLDEIVIAPGETFSYNKTLGARTIEAGYKEAAIYVGGKVVDGLGGGICQISTILYNAVLEANLEIVERKCHQFLPSYAKPGLDATVAYGSIDFQFKNNRTYPIKINTNIVAGVAEIEILGIKEDTDVEVILENKVLETIPYETEYITNTSLEEGTSRVIQGGTDGKVVEAYKITLKAGKEVSRELISFDKYDVLNEIVEENN